MLDQLKADIGTMIDLAKQIENYDATLAAMRMAGKPIQVDDSAAAERHRRELHLADLRMKWGV